MGYTYIFRFADSDLYKLGMTRTMSTRSAALKTGNRDKLQLHDSVETEHPLEGEQFLKRLWTGRRHRPRSEIFRLTEAEVDGGMAQLRHYLEYVLPGELAERAQVVELADVDNTETMIDPSDDIKAAHHRLIEILVAMQALESEAESLRRSIVLAIGKNRGITGVATFDKADGNRWFNAERFQATHPDIAAQFVKTTIDGTALRKQYPDLHESFKEPARKRKFTLNEDLDAGA
ncbi:GIY-YIG nuclease family protein [Nocardia heshunensis]